MAKSSYLEKKNVHPSFNLYLVQASSAMAQGLFCSLLVGLFFKTIGAQFEIKFIHDLGILAMSLLGPAIGVSIAIALKAPNLVLFSSLIVGMIGNQLGGPVGAYVATIVATELGKLVAGETRLDIFVTPWTTLITGAAVAHFIAPSISEAMTFLGQFLMHSTQLHPFWMGVILSATVGMILTLPISSAALCIMIGLGGIAGGAATVGCCAQMIGFAAISYKDNAAGGILSQAIGTSMLQIGNIVKNPWIWVPPTLAGAILGPVSTMIFKMQNIPMGAGMGTSGLVGQFTTITKMGTSIEVFSAIFVLHFVAPALIALFFYHLLVKFGRIKPGDLSL